jgi:formylglycine-generating enzyme required for sulfatase activity
MGHGEANCSGCGSRWDGRRSAPVGSFAPNPFGLHDMNGNVSEWVEDCHRDTPSDFKRFDCSLISGMRLVRGGGWRDAPHATRSAARAAASVTHFDNRIGFRVARSD